MVPGLVEHRLSMQEKERDGDEEGKEGWRVGGERGEEEVVEVEENSKTERGIFLARHASVKAVGCNYCLTPGGRLCYLASTCCYVASSYAEPEICSYSNICFYRRMYLFLEGAWTD